MERSNVRHGIITKGIGGLYRVRLMREDSTYEDIECRARGKFRHDGVTPLPGDDAVILTEGDRSEYVIDDIMPRHSSLLRPPMANLTHLFLLIPSCRPKPDLLTADKITAIAEHAGIETVIIAGKNDMDRESAAAIADIYTKAGYRVFNVSTVTGDGIDELKSFIDNAAEEGISQNRPVRAAFAGVSGAGKSTLMTALFPDLKLTVGSVSRKTERGRHTTREVELFPLVSSEGHEFYLADTPGFSMLDFTRYNFFAASELAENFREFADCLGECRYTKCTHTKEDGCAILDAVAEKAIPKSRHTSYLEMYDALKDKRDWDK